MTLVLQIAAGIVLGYLIIRFRHSVWAIFSVLAVVALIVAVVAGLSAGVGALSEEIGINWEIAWDKVLNVASMIPIFALAGCGAFGLLTLFQILFRTERPRAEGDGCLPVLLFFGFLNAIILTLIAVGIEALFPGNPVTGLANGIDEWSRSAGYKDLGSVLFGTAMMALWPWLVIAAIIGIAKLYRKVRRRSEEPTSESAVS